MPMPSSPGRRSKPWYTRWWAIALFVAIGAVAIACAIGDDDDDDEDDDGISEQFDDFEVDDAAEDVGLFAVVTIVDSGSWKITAPQG